MSTTTTSADPAAPLGLLLVQAAPGPYRRFVPDASTAKFAAHLLRHPRRTGGRYQTNDKNPLDPHQWQATTQTRKGSW